METEKNISKRICYVTAFIDIGRDKWKSFPRTRKQYLQHFYPFITMFEKMTEEEIQEYCMVVFIDERVVDQLEIPTHLPLSVVPCSQAYLMEHIPTWSYLEREREIIESEGYKKFLGVRAETFPENFSAEYTIMTTSKVDFVVHAMDYIEAEYYCWVDFGYFKLRENIPSRPLDLEKLALDKINLQLLNPLTDLDRDIFYTIRFAPERIAGAFVFGSKDKFLEYQTLYHEIHDEFHSLGLVDDDQHLAMRCYFKKPDLFALHQHYWSRSLVVFQKEETS